MITPLQLFWVLVGVAFGAAGSICLKVGAVGIDYRAGYVHAIWQMATSPYVVGGFFLYTIPSLIWIILLKSMPLSLLQPLLALTYVVTPLMAIYFLSESVSPMRWVGIATIVVGVCVVARG